MIMSPSKYGATQFDLEDVHLDLTWEELELGISHPDSKVHGAIMGLIWGRQDPGGPHVGPMNLAIWDNFCYV